MHNRALQILPINHNGYVWNRSLHDFSNFDRFSITRCLTRRKNFFARLSTYPRLLIKFLNYLSHLTKLHLVPLRVLLANFRIANQQKTHKSRTKFTLWERWNVGRRAPSKRHSFEEERCKIIRPLLTILILLPTDRTMCTERTLFSNPVRLFDIAFLRSTR